MPRKAVFTRHCFGTESEADGNMPGLWCRGSCQAAPEARLRLLLTPSQHAYRCTWPGSSAGTAGLHMHMQTIISTVLSAAMVIQHSTLT